jgi:hypothetical protein
MIPPPHRPTSRLRVLATRVLPARIRLALWSACLSGTLVSLGCHPSAERSATERERVDVQATVQQVLQAYADCRAYSDRGRITLSYGASGTQAEEVTDVECNFQRPNRLRLVLTSGGTRLSIVSDGRRMQASIDDPLSQDFDGQRVLRSPGDRLSMADLYAVAEMLDPDRPGELISMLFSLPVPLELSPLGLALGQTPLSRLLSEAVTGTRAETVDGVRCDVVQVQDEAGVYTLWIDPGANLIRRIRYPVSTGDGPADGAGRQGVQLQADFHRARFTVEDPSRAFALSELPAGQAVQHFVLPPMLPETPLLGQVVSGLGLTDLHDQPLGDTWWQGRIAVLVWFNEHATSQQALSQVERLRQQYAADGRVVFLAVCAEPGAALGTQAVADLLDGWQVDLPTCRDAAAAGRDILGIEQAPTTVVLGADGTLQAFRLGVYPELARDLEDTLRRLLSGANVARERMEGHRRSRQAYQQSLAAARLDPAKIRAPESPSVLAPRGEPRQMRITPLWTSRDVANPGNLLLVADATGAVERLWALSGWREVVALDASGHVAERHTLAIPADAGVSWLATATDSQQTRWYAGAARGGKHVFLWDDQWQVIRSYRAPSDEDARIRDMQLIDLEQDGELELYVALAGDAGLRRFSLSGELVWSNQSAGNVLSVAPWQDGSDAGCLLVTGESGRVTQVAADGRTLREVAIGRRAIHQVFTVPPSTVRGRGPACCAVSYTADQQPVAIGLNGQLRELWNYRLPAGTYQHLVESPQAGRLFAGDSWQWILAGPDGSVHVISADGGFFDSLNLGSHIRGIVGGEFGDRRALVVAAGEEITAFEITR